MHALCELIAKEQDHEKFARLVKQLNDLLENKEQRLQGPSSKT